MKYKIKNHIIEANSPVQALKIHKVIDSVKDVKWEVGNRVRYDGEWYYIVNHSRGVWILENENDNSQIQVADSVKDSYYSELRRSIKKWAYTDGYTADKIFNLIKKYFPESTLKERQEAYYEATGTKFSEKIFNSVKDANPEYAIWVKKDGKWLVWGGSNSGLINKEDFLKKGYSDVRVVKNGEEVHDSEEVDFDYLLSQEHKAVNDYEEAIKSTTDEKLIELFNHIKAEELDHIKELENAKNGNIEISDSKYKDEAIKYITPDKKYAVTLEGHHGEIYGTENGYLKELWSGSFDGSDPKLLLEFWKKANNIKDSKCKDFSKDDIIRNLKVGYKITLPDYDDTDYKIINITNGGETFKLKGLYTGHNLTLNYNELKNALYVL